MTSTASNSEQVSAWTAATQQRRSVQHCLNIQYKALIQGPLKSLTYINAGSGLSSAEQKTCSSA